MTKHTLVAFTLAFAFAASPLLAQDNASSTLRQQGPLERREMREDRVEKKINKLEDRMAREVKNGNASSTIDVACAKTAIDVRGTATLAAFNAHAATVAATIASSTAGHKAAFDLTGADRKKALRAVQQSAKMARLQARKTMLNAEKIAFTTFKTSMKACGARESEIEKGEPIVQ